jgi:hypothetical protein
VGGVVAIVALAATFIASTISNTRLLYRREPLPAKKNVQARVDTNPVSGLVVS